MKKIIAILSILAFNSFAQNYFPIDVGYYWDYKMYVPPPFSINQSYRLEVIEVTNVDSTKVYKFKTYAGLIGYYAIKGNDVDVMRAVSEIVNDNKIAQIKYQNNDQWASQKGEFKVTGSNLTLTTSKHAFTNCVSLEDDWTGDIWYYADNIGHVYSMSLDSSYELLTNYYVGNTDILKINKMVIKRPDKSKTFFTNLLGRNLKTTNNSNAANIIVEKNNSYNFKRVILSE